MAADTIRFIVTVAIVVYKGLIPVVGRMLTKKLLFFFLKTIIFLRKLLLFLQNVFVFLEVHNFTLVRMSLYGRMRSLTHTYVKLHADVRVKACFPT